MKQILLVTIVVLFSTLFSSAQIPTDGLVGYWSFSGNANDESGNNYDGTVNGATLSPDRFGNQNSAYQFDGTDDHILIDNTAGNFGSTDFAISYWMYVDQLPTIQNQDILGKRAAGSWGNYFNFSLTTSGGVGLEINEATSADRNVCTTTAGVILDQWNHITLVRNGLDLDIYLNGQLSNSVVSNIAHDINNDVELVFGSRYYNNDLVHYFKGGLDDIRFYSRALSQNEISNLYNETNDGLIAHYPFNGNANDESGNNNHGTINGATLTDDRFGKPNSAYDFDGNDDYIDLGVIEGYSSHSFSGWFKIEGQQDGWGVLVSKLYDDGNHTFMSSEIRIDPDFGSGYKFSSQLGTGAQWAGNRIETPINDSEWQYFAYIYDDSEKRIKLYWNSNLVDNISVTGYNDTENTPTYIGARPYHNVPITYFFNGLIDDVKIYNRPLTVEEINSEYQEFITTEVEKKIKNVEFSIYPNPASEKLFIDCNLFKLGSGIKIKIYDITGNEVYGTSINQQLTRIDLNNIHAKGIYLVQVVDINSKILDSQKVIIR
ncbi:LamG-like jellyroll fold domain-containing protein [Labilibacter marinus]|uniref:LamG-like jellyroll fold domain-containing protein n=1 Tax=Labilibacter marinus TaxID=1477105 RepID=UPI000831F4C0|nr:LamG-like jellyroll fold domain-containing protein [Labilibacter marinus]